MLEMPAVPYAGRCIHASAFWAARVGNEAALLQARDQLSHIVANWPSQDANAARDHADALVALRRRDVQKAEDLLIRASGFAGARSSLIDLADLYFATGRFAEADMQWQLFEKKRGLFFYEFFPGVILLVGSNAPASHKRAGTGLRPKHTPKSS